MKKNISKILIIIIFISICSILYTKSVKTDIVDVRGNNDFWRASLNINPRYNCELVISPATDEFELPSEINVDVLVKNKSIYTDKLRIIKNKNFSKFGVYKSTFDSNKYLERNYKDVYVVINFNDETSEIPLTLIKYP
ncbi:hypothetical protein [Tissierella praeacuta]|uniref:hypothetical protein n=1 Tax=Tissierella praeacuta TaxID=43131 RepID=UPI0028AF9662|nr:hypothetical protein [Tissierella praeacuta]